MPHDFSPEESDKKSLKENREHKPVKCSICGEVLAGRSLLRSHYNLKHCGWYKPKGYTPT